MNSFALALDSNGTRPAAEQPGFFSGFQYGDHGEDQADIREVTEDRIDLTIRNPTYFAKVSSRRYVFVRRFYDGVLKVVAGGRAGGLGTIVTVYYLNEQQIRKFGV